MASLILAKEKSDLLSSFACGELILLAQSSVLFACPKRTEQINLRHNTAIYLYKFASSAKPNEAKKKGPENANFSLFGP
jgi:hypothetical protein